MTAKTNKPNLKTLYDETIRAALQKEFSLQNVMEVPVLEKISVNMGVGEAASDSKAVKAAEADLTRICGQKPVVTVAKKSIAGFKLRQGQPIGCKVTLRGNRMYEFLERLIYVALPRVRDFRGVSSKSFDGRGNYSLGLKEQIVFPEIDYDKTDKIRGLDIVVVTSTDDNDKAKALLKAFNMPFYN